MYMEDFDDQLFSGEDREFSSFAYRIAAAKNLGRFMRMPPMMFPDDENAAKVEALLSNWRMHLPATKRDDLNKQCQLDEMMFQAHYIIHACVCPAIVPDSRKQPRLTPRAPAAPSSSTSRCRSSTPHPRAP
jgi:hypothetical protein